MRLLYYLVLKPLSLLPLSILYSISTPIYLIIMYVVRYRREVVQKQLTTSFPEKSDVEIRRITRRFYRHFVDLLVESLRLFSMPKKEIEKRYRITNPTIYETAREKGQHLALVASHYNSWEMACYGFKLYIKNETFVIYSPLMNVFMDQKIRETRERFGIQMVSKKGLHEFFSDRDNHSSTILIFAADQSPRTRSAKHWINFLNQPTAFMTGTERYAKKYNLPVYYMTIKKVKRGHYETTFKLLTENPNSLPEGHITALHAQALEEEIRQDPAYWLWSHKRWKKKMTEEDDLIRYPESVASS